jgi:hypothetical protein
LVSQLRELGLLKAALCRRLAVGKAYDMSYQSSMMVGGIDVKGREMYIRSAHTNIPLKRCIW